MDDPEEMLRLAELLQGVSVDCPSLSSEMDSEGEKPPLFSFQMQMFQKLGWDYK